MGLRLYEEEMFATSEKILDNWEIIIPGYHSGHLWLHSLENIEDLKDYQRKKRKHSD